MSGVRRGCGPTSLNEQNSVRPHLRSTAAAPRKAAYGRAETFGSTLDCPRLVPHKGARLSLPRCHRKAFGSFFKFFQPGTHSSVLCYLAPTHVGGREMTCKL